MISRVNRVTNWQSVDKREWRSSDGRLRVVMIGIKRDAMRHAAYAGAQYVGTYASLEMAKLAAEEAFGKRHNS